MQFPHSQLLLIRWYSSPTPGDSTYALFLQQLRARLEAAAAPFYILSDLRFGCIVDEDTLDQLAHLLQHRNFAGGTAFSLSPIAHIYVRRFERQHATPQDIPCIFDTADEALHCLDKLSPGLAETVCIDDIDAVAV